MGNLFCQKCDLCPKIQTEENPANIKGTMFTMNGVSRFACAECRSILDAAFSVGSEGLREPILELAKVVEENKQLKRLLAQAKFQKESGTASLVGVELDHVAMQKFNALEDRFKPAAQVLGNVPLAGSLGYREIKPEAPKKGIGYKGKKKK